MSISVAKKMSVGDQAETRISRRNYWKKLGVQFNPNFEATKCWAHKMRSKKQTQLRKKNVNKLTQLYKERINEVTDKGIYAGWSDHQHTTGITTPNAIANYNEHHSINKFNKLNTPQKWRKVLNVTHKYLHKCKRSPTSRHWGFFPISPLYLSLLGHKQNTNKDELWVEMNT